MDFHRQAKDKGKGKAVARSASPAIAPAHDEPSLETSENTLTSLIIASTSTEPSTSAQAESQAAEIARLTQQLNEQNAVSITTSWIFLVLIHSLLASAKAPEPT